MQFDVNLIWYGILLMINLELAVITPPVGMNLFVIKGIAKVLSDECELVSIRTVTLRFMPRRDRATRQERRRG